MKTYRGTRISPFKVAVTVDDRALDPKSSQHIWNHSPDGFNWGYGGSGPSQLALAMLLDHFNDPILARKYYQDFKWEVVSRLPDTWEITGAQIDHVIYHIAMSPPHLTTSTEIKK
jgi:hypothetical protein